MQARITGGIINIHLTVIIRNSTIGKYTLETSLTRSQPRGAIKNPAGSAITFHGSTMGLWAGGAVFIRLSEPFAAGAGIDHLIQGNTA